MNLDDNLQRLVARFEELAHLMAGDAASEPGAYAKLSKEYAELNPIVERIRELEAGRSELADLAEIMTDAGGDGDLKRLAEAEFYTLKERLPDLEHELKLLLLPKPENDEKNVILEIRAGAGGDEAGLFGGELLRMYQRYAENRGWKFEMISLSESGIGGLKEGIAAIRGHDVFGRLKFESGVHRVQRVPETESGGRIHTSTATVAIMAEPEDVEVDIEDKDLRIDVFRASGPGGQSVNTTDSAVRITHLPTGIVVSQQDEKSQHKNKAKALKVLRARIYDFEQAKADAERSADRRGQVGTGDRSERIRTYNFPQGRVTDHRIGLTLHKLDRVIAGEGLDEVIDALVTEDQAARLATLT
ncbi:MAG: peptide chain release factor 1 [Proteobacteria bacterium]|nr:peptide chain release factor 1 [Pseudomonadota bacterium]